SEVGSRKSEVGSRKSEVGSRKSEVGSRKSEVGSRKSEVGSRKSEVVKKERENTILNSEYPISFHQNHYLIPIAIYQKTFNGVLRGTYCLLFP
ncbi:MAG: hypothetical protein AAF348_13865, partial [Bacteroidota bacterium]